MKKLTKSNRDRKICGVCGGIAEYLNVDPVIVRLAAAIAVLAGGTGGMAYVIAAILMPEAEAAAE